MNQETGLGPCVIAKGTNAEQARGLAENLGHEYCTELEGFVLTPQELADVLNANLTYIAEPLDTTVIRVSAEGDPEPVDITVHGTEKMLKRLVALLNGYSRSSELMMWIASQDRLLIERWRHPGNRESVSVYTALDDEDKPSGRAEDTHTALTNAKRHQESL